MFDRISLARCLPFVVYMAFVMVADLLERCGLSDASLLWVYPVKIIAVSITLYIYRREYVELANTTLGFLNAVVAVVAGVVVFALWIKLGAEWLKIGSPTGFDPNIDGQMNYWLVFSRLVGAALVVPVMEELFWRSFLLRWVTSSDFLAVDPRSVKWFGFAVVAVLFGVEHSLWFAGVVAGVVYGCLYIYSRNLWSAVLAHGITNGVLGVWIIATEQWTYW